MGLIPTHLTECKLSDTLWKTVCRWCLEEKRPPLCISVTLHGTYMFREQSIKNWNAIFLPFVFAVV